MTRAVMTAAGCSGVMPGTSTRLVEDQRLVHLVSRVDEREAEPAGVGRLDQNEPVRQLQQHHPRPVGCRHGVHLDVDHLPAHHWDTRIATIARFITNWNTAIRNMMTPVRRYRSISSRTR